ncbi:unnamed protein product [Effrenium voratum]|uniref:N-acetyltransferase domain-containing protein n=1 Tax=Effrenium voratum TaxID=2562239 RepID=A0AA36J571_9DINO|nr:unnamed protein product [Effrenium voratum]CAJ1399827.1 unnamed protein product [Effrenium voratum]CAJ1447776.1 unnamed protein product [Effrenium voratum]
MAGRFLLPFDGSEEESDQDWLAEPPRIHQAAVRQLPSPQRSVEHRRPGKQLLRQRSFHAPCAQDELQLCITLETPEEAPRLQGQVAAMKSSMGGMQELLLEQFIEKDYDDDLLLLTATDQGGNLVGMIFWRYLRSSHDEFWRHVLVDMGSEALALRTPPEAWVLIELLCTGDAFRGRGVGKLLLVAALAYSAVKDGKQAAVLTLGRGDANLAAAELYRKLGFQQMPDELFVEPEDGAVGGRWVDPKHVLVLWDIRRGLRPLTMDEVSGSKKGIHVPQLEVGQASGADLRRLDSAQCREVVHRLTG